MAVWAGTDEEKNWLEGFSEDRDVGPAVDRVDVVLGRPPNEKDDVPVAGVAVDDGAPKVPKFVAGAAAAGVAATPQKPKEVLGVAGVAGVAGMAPNWKDGAAGVWGAPKPAAPVGVAGDPKPGVEGVPLRKLIMIKANKITQIQRSCCVS